MFVKFVTLAWLIPEILAVEPRCYFQLEANVDHGECGSEPRFYYSHNANTCYNFIGCLNEDGNNFGTLEQCEQACRRNETAPTTPPKFAAAVMPMDLRCHVNPARDVDYNNCGIFNNLTRYYWSPTIARCFPFKGCINFRGNNWSDRQECQANCGTLKVAGARPDLDICSMALRDGVDFASFCTQTRFYYSSQLQQCIGFRGCQTPTPGNNFPDFDSCLEECSKNVQTTTDNKPAGIFAGLLPTYPDYGL